ncbi:MAG: 2-succinyl-5-enolpyruvyl-6-hydroxy-3-cyclohexene-1-carboxylic-acid synthase [Bacteroidales bacterium]|nr:2-succinyl-5-enolpyruvyl-6-hydroxy-3-cyclohexene-1-carboxylic-acid synthase [Bacteroidales bacterium]
MTPDKENIFILAYLLHKKGITHIVTSPGSRNAPAIIVFNRSGWFNMYSVADERAAGFFALGMAQALRRSVALICTSGTAALNYYPALTEAFYQQIPLIAITADRPSEWIDQADGQTIRQENVFSNHTRYNISLPEDATDSRFSARLINTAIDKANFPVPGPVHINLPLREPLYDLDLTNYKTDYPIMEVVSPIQSLPAEIGAEWKSKKKKMVLVGQMLPEQINQKWIERLNNDSSVIVFVETTSNFNHPTFIACTDRMVEALTPQDITELKPDLLVSLGGSVVSKKIKALLRKWKPSVHWHITPDSEAIHTDTYLSLSHTFIMTMDTFLSSLPESPAQFSDYRDRWLAIKRRAENKHNTFLKAPSFTDFFVFHRIFEALPNNEVVHLGNSTPIRYAQLFEHKPGRKFFGNRGTSGIDGCISTAAGYAAVSAESVTSITGDIGFFYESNALWNRHIPSSFTIILINNGGGNIFRIIDGPSHFEELEPFIEMSHQTHARGIAESFGAEYYFADNFTSLGEALSNRYDHPREKPAVIEIKTQAAENALILKQYFQNLK